MAHAAGLRAATEGRLNDAERFFKIYLLDEPDSASGWSNLGNVHQQQGQAQQAVEDYSKAVALAPEVSDCVLALLWLTAGSEHWAGLNCCDSACLELELEMQFLEMHEKK